MKNKHHITPFQQILFSFMGLILVGSILLMLPISSRTGTVTNFLDALFTSTSASCVTGLVVYDTYNYWSPFGQFVIISLIQIGGLGVISIGAFFIILSGKKLGITARVALKESSSYVNTSHVLSFVKLIFKFSILVEIIFGLIMSPSFIREFGFFKGLLYSFFHSVSAYCNAGFDLMGMKAPTSSLTYFHNDTLIVLTICIIILIGGTGFLTFDDIFTNKFNFKKYRLQSKIIIITNIFLIVLPFLFYFLVEYSNPAYGITNLWERFLASIFQTITPRTAGFNTMDLNAMSESGKALMIVLMLIGGAPGSTAGGAKITTFAVLLISTRSVFRSAKSVSAFKKTISDDIVKAAAAIATLYIALGIGAAMEISIIEGLPLMDCMFETCSAVATVGLSLGITSSLHEISKIILIMLMYFGRVGGLTLIYATFSAKKADINYPTENITV